MDPRQSATAGSDVILDPGRDLDLDLDPAVVLPPDPSAAPESFVVVIDGVDRIAFHDWGGPSEAGASGGPPVLLIHGISGSALAWAPIARRLRARRRVVAMDLRGHGLSDAPTYGYDPDGQASDALAAAEGAGLMPGPPFVIAGHGFGAAVAAWAAALLGDRCAGLVLVDGGWEELGATSGLDPDEFLRESGESGEPPEVLASMAAWLADRREFDPASWDADQEAAARAAVVELPVGRVTPATRPHVVEACVRSMFAYDPAVVLPSVAAPIVALLAGDDEAGERSAALGAAQSALVAAGRPPIRAARFPRDGHNLMRYRPAEVAAAILAVSVATPGGSGRAGTMPRP
jgi:pimeloyl-ACP methyl ester carboxylesterase